jgi:hypothetical protein
MTLKLTTIWETCVNKVISTACFTLVSCLAYSSTLKMEVTCFQRMSLDFHRTTRRHIAEDRTLRNYRCENLKSSILFACSLSFFKSRIHELSLQYAISAIFLSMVYGLWSAYLRTSQKLLRAARNTHQIQKKQIKLPFCCLES